METVLTETDIADKKPTSVPAIGFAIACLGAITVFFSTIAACVLTFVDFDDIIANDPAFTVGPFAQQQGDIQGIFAFMKILFIVGIPWGVLYLVGGIQLRKFKLWANRLLCVLVGAGVFVGPLIVTNFVKMVPSPVKGAYDGIWIYSFVEGAIMAGALIWYLNSKKIRPHFT